MNRFELWDKVARNSQCRLPRHFRLVVALWSLQPMKTPQLTIKHNLLHTLIIIVILLRT